MVVGQIGNLEHSRCQLRCRALVSCNTWKLERTCCSCCLDVHVCWCPHFDRWPAHAFFALMEGLTTVDVCYANDYCFSDLPPEVMLCDRSLLLHLPPEVMLLYWSLRHEFEKVVAISNLFHNRTWSTDESIFGIEKKAVWSIDAQGKFIKQRALGKEAPLAVLQ